MENTLWWVMIGCGASIFACILWIYLTIREEVRQDPLYARAALGDAQEADHG